MWNALFSRYPWNLEDKNCSKWSGCETSSVPHNPMNQVCRNIKHQNSITKHWLMPAEGILVILWNTITDYEQSQNQRSCESVCPDDWCLAICGGAIACGGLRIGRQWQTDHFLILSKIFPPMSVSKRFVQQAITDYAKQIRFWHTHGEEFSPMELVGMEKVNFCWTKKMAAWTLMKYSHPPVMLQGPQDSAATSTCMDSFYISTWSKVTFVGHCWFFLLTKQLANAKKTITGHLFSKGVEELVLKYEY